MKKQAWLQDALREALKKEGQRDHDAWVKRTSEGAGRLFEALTSLSEASRAKKTKE